MANEKILVVDDDKNICELLRLYLVKEGYNVTMVHDGGAPRGRLFQKRLERKERICYNTFIYANRPVRRSAWQKFSKNSKENFEI